MDYRSYIQSDLWRTKRSLVLQRDGYECKTCDSRENLEVHHRHYRGCNQLGFGNEPISDLITLCSECHLMITILQKVRKKITMSKTISAESRVNNYLEKQIRLLRDDVGPEMASRMLLEVSQRLLGDFPVKKEEYPRKEIEEDFLPSPPETLKPDVKFQVDPMPVPTKTEEDVDVKAVGNGSPESNWRNRIQTNRIEVTRLDKLRTCLDRLPDFIPDKILESPLITKSGNYVVPVEILSEAYSYLDTDDDSFSDKFPGLLMFTVIELEKKLRILDSGNIKHSDQDFEVLF